MRGGVGRWGMRIMGSSPALAGTPVLRLSLRRRPCAKCGRPARLTFFSPATALAAAMNDGLLTGLLGVPSPPPGDGQCCTRCTRELRSGG